MITIFFPPSMSFMDIHYWFRDHGYAAHLDDSTRGYAFTFQLS